LPWESAREISISEFFQQYSIHDSDWITLSLNLEFYKTAILTIRWYYQYGALGHAISIERKKGNIGPHQGIVGLMSHDEVEIFKTIRPEYATLLIKIENIQNIAISPEDNTLINDRWGMFWGGIGAGYPQERDGKHALVVTANMGGDVTIIFNGKTFFLALDDDKKVIEI